MHTETQDMNQFANIEETMPKAKKKSNELQGSWLTRSYVNRAELRRRWQMICLGGNRGPGFQEFKHGIWVYHGL